jgi:flavin-dependent dehydrogenase
LLVGDAGGFADPLLGEGIYYAHKSAQLAVEAIRKACRNGQHAEPVYSQFLIKHIINELRYTKILRSFLFSLPIDWQLKMLNVSFKTLLPKLEEAVQGQRSFKLLLPKSHF